MLGVAGAVTVTGFVCDINGRRAKKAGTNNLYPSFSKTIPAASAGSTDGVNLYTLTGPINPTDYPDATGFIINILANVYVDIQDNGVPDPDFKANPTQFPIINSGNGIKLGRIV